MYLEEEAFIGKNSCAEGQSTCNESRSPGVKSGSANNGFEKKSGWNHKGKVIPKDAEMFGFLTTKLLRMDQSLSMETD